MYILWEMIGETIKFPSTPVIYVNKAGLYQFEVKYGSVKMQGKIIDVRVELGMFSCYCVRLRLEFPIFKYLDSEPEGEQNCE